MASDSETEAPKGRELLRVTYKGQVYSLPVAGNLIDLKFLLGTWAVPGLARLQATASIGDDVGIALIRYMYDANEFFVGQPEAEEAFKELESESID